MNDLIELFHGAFLSTILTHGDCDGICSGAITLAKYPESRLWFTRPASLIHDLRKINDSSRLVICDIAINESHKKQIKQLIMKITRKSELLYIDHHPLPEGFSFGNIRDALIIHNTKASTSELAFKHLDEGLSWKLQRVAAYGAIGDHLDDTPWMKDIFNRWDKRALYFQSGLLVLTLQEIFNQTEKRKLVEDLSIGMSPSELPDFVNKAVRAANTEDNIFSYVKERCETVGDISYIVDIPHRGFNGSAALFAAAIGNTPVGISVRTEKSALDISIRRRNERIDLNKLIRKTVTHIANSHGGGHPSAAGATIPKSSWKRFLSLLNEYTKS